MGIKILDNVDIKNSGITMSNLYASFCRNSIQITKDVDNNNNITYRAHSLANIWKDYDSRNCQKTPIDGIPVMITLTSEQLDTNIYTQLYTALKAKYTTTEDIQ